ncbi:S1C family serine protease [Roseomonas sp. BN140053]|uniref:S1C family serine protease n=1 Tax=Roseomonas sp. BN140053 TaxID=3391898 RepID=UPI0039ECF0D8
MARSGEQGRVPAANRPRPDDYAFDLDRALSAVVALRARVPEDAYTAGTLGTERTGSAVLINDSGLLLTIGYLITEAEEIWLTAVSGRVVPGHVLGFDNASGFGLVQALGRLDLPPLPRGDSRALKVGEPVVLAGAGGRDGALAGRVVARQEFAGYWEYLVDEAIFTAPCHPHWGGTALIGPAGELLGIGSLQLMQEAGEGRPMPINMVVPIDLLEPVLPDILAAGRVQTPPRPWLGLFAAEDDGRVVVAGLAGDGPARRAGLRVGDAILAVGNNAVTDLAGLFRRTWELGAAGVEVPLTLNRDGDTFSMRVTSGDRQRFLKAPSLH